jgi:hypothetical protein
MHWDATLPVSGHSEILSERVMALAITRRLPQKGKEMLRRLAGGAQGEPAAEILRERSGSKEPAQKGNGHLVTQVAVIVPAMTYSPTQFPAQYNRPGGA